MENKKFYAQRQQEKTQTKIVNRETWTYKIKRTPKYNTLKSPCVLSKLRKKTIKFHKINKRLTFQHSLLK